MECFSFVLYGLFTMEHLDYMVGTCRPVTYSWISCFWRCSWNCY